MWPTVMSVVWNKKEELIVDQAIRHLREYIPLQTVHRELGPCADDAHAEGAGVLLREHERDEVLQQDHSLYKADVLHEEVIMRWYKDTQEGKAKGQDGVPRADERLIDWHLKNAEEESDDDDEDEE